MDRRSWPWKKKTSEKSAAEKAIATLDFAGGYLPSGESQVDKSYSHLAGLENKVKAYEEHAKMYEEHTKGYEEHVLTLEVEIKELNEKLSSANYAITTKEGLVKQHAKVAEEAVSGWEKAEAEASALKNCLESVTLAKLTVEDRAAHLDGALKECMRQIRNLKEDNEDKLQQVAFTKNKQYDRMKLELETKIACLDQDLMRAEAESAALSRSLQERSNMLIKVSEEKSRAEADIELLKSNVESCEREINSLKYELHIVTKEMEIRNEEKNMCVKTAEVANKHQVESVKKIAKLEAECQRLRGLVRKKLPGPAALAQMKLEVESLGRDHRDTHIRRSLMRPSSPQFSSDPHMLAVPEFSLDDVQRFQNENEFLTQRLFTMEEETKMLKEALAKRNSELQTSRSICAKTASKLQSLEVRVLAFNQHNRFPRAERSPSQHACNSPSMASFSEDGNDDTVSYAESCSSALISELFHINEKKDKSLKSENGSHLEFMNDFEEMEKLARNDPVSASDISPSKTMTVNGDLVNVNSSSMPSTLKVNNMKINQELVTAISQIHNYVLTLGKEARAGDCEGLSHKIDQFSLTFNRVLCNEISVDDFIYSLFDVMAKASEIKFNFLGYKVNEAEANSPACIDKVALSENKSPQGKSYSHGCGHISDSSSNPEFPQEANIVSGFEPISCNCSTEEVEQLKVEKNNMEREFFRCSQDLEIAKSQLKEMEQQLSEVKSELQSSQKMNSLAETQLKCMAESYKTVEKRAGELECEVNDLRKKMESLNIELEFERTSREHALARCKDLDEQVQRSGECSLCSPAKVDAKAKQEMELEAAAEKLAACQETIFLLGKQLKSMRPQTGRISYPNAEKSSKSEGLNMDQVEMDTATSPTLQRVSSDSTLDLYNAPFSPSDTERNITRSSVTSKSSRHRPTNSGSSTASSTTPEKHSRGVSRFFSSKGKNSY